LTYDSGLQLQVRLRNLQRVGDVREGDPDRTHFGGGALLMAKNVS
jgi:hypothetical protein